MFKYLGKRLLHSLIVLIGISIVIFVLIRLVPGDPARMALGDHAAQEAIDALREEMHLNDPLYLQYYSWARDVLKGNFGYSLTTIRPVISDVKEFLPASLELVILSGIIQVIFAFVLGIIAAYKKDKLVDGVIRISSYIFISVPGFVWAVLFLLFFGSIWPILPVANRISSTVVAPNTITGLYVIDYLLQGNLRGAGDAFAHLILPSLALSLGHIFQEARILRSSLIDNSQREFISVTRSFGVPERTIMSKYLLKPSATSVITVAALDFSSTLGNAFLIETIFNWPGISRYGLNAMLSKDLNAVSIVILIIGVTFIIANMMVDIINAALNPQMRLR